MASRFAPDDIRVSAVVLTAGAVLALMLSSATPAFALGPHDVRTATTSTCVQCHSTHSSTGVMLLRTDSSTDQVTALCLSCHGGSGDAGADVVSGRQNSFWSDSGHVLDSEATGPADVRGCATCHDVHGSSSDARMIPAKQINGKTPASAGPGLCLACHDADNAWYGRDYPSTAEPTRDATGFPISGTWPGPETYLSDSNAHRLIPEATQTVGANATVQREQGDCRYCHASHGSANAYDGLVTTYTVPATSTLTSDRTDGSFADLCFSCHGGATPSGFATAPVDIRQFAIGSSDTGHRIVTAGGSLPVGSPLPCFECHNPHGSQRGNQSLISDERGASLSTTDAAGVRSFCFTCHTTSDTGAGWDGDSSYMAVGPEVKVVGLPRDGAALRLRDTDGHAETDGESCYECHGESYAPGGNNVHDPKDGDSVQVAKPSEVATASAVASDTIPGTTIEASSSVEATQGVAGSSTPTESSAPLVPEESLALTVTGGVLRRRKESRG